MDTQPPSLVDGRPTCTAPLTMHLMKDGEKRWQFCAAPGFQGLVPQSSLVEAPAGAQDVDTQARYAFAFFASLGASIMVFSLLSKRDTPEADGF